MADLSTQNSGGNPPSAENGARVDLSAVKKRGRGRPSNAEKAARGEKVSSPSKSDASGEADASLDAGFLADAVCYLFETADEILSRRAMARIQKVFPSESEAIQELVRQAGLTERDLGLVRKCVLRIAAKYDFVTKYGPEILMFGMVAQYGVRQSRVFSRISELEAKIAKAKNVTPQPKVEPAKT